MLKWRNPSTFLIQPLGGSASHLRLRYEVDHIDKRLLALGKQNQQIEKSRGGLYCAFENVCP